MSTTYEQKYGKDMTGREILEEAKYTCETCMADPCENCGACEQYRLEGFGI